MKYQRLYDINLKDFGHLSDVQLGGLTIYAEARGESDQGRIGVGTVIMERVDHRNWDGKTVKEVCLWPWQYSCYLPGDKNRPIILSIAQNYDAELAKNKILQKCHGIMSGLLDGSIPRDPDLAAVNCCQYLNPLIAKKTRDEWIAKGMKIIKKVGKHEFFDDGTK